MSKDREIALGLPFAGAIFCLDVVLFGATLWSYIICPIWFPASVLQSLIWMPGWKVARVRIAIPVLTLVIIMGSTAIQWMLTEAKANRIIAACEKYKAVNGSYPQNLDELVPKYLPSIPLAKYCLILPVFEYCNSDARAMLWWYTIPPFGRQIYNFEDGHWGYLD